jgi:hypothetical protein
MRGIQSVKKLFFKLSDFERVRSRGLHCYEPSALQRDGTNDNLVPVNAVFPHEQKSLKPLVDSLEVWWGSKDIFGMPKRELDFRCSPVFAFVLLCTRNREKRRYLRFLSSSAKSIGPIGAFARLLFCISASALHH